MMEDATFNGGGPEHVVAARVRVQRAQGAASLRRQRQRGVQRLLPPQMRCVVTF
jgi:hypothetical protein